jgi:hypothetical protein
MPAPRPEKIRSVIKAAMEAGVAVQRVRVTPEGEIILETIPAEDFHVNPADLVDMGK